MRITNFQDLLDNRKKLTISQDISKQGIEDSNVILNAEDILKSKDKEDKESKSISTPNITLESLNLINKHKQSIGAGFQKGEQPREGEERDWKDGKYRFIDGHWKKVSNIDKEEENKGKSEKYKGGASSYLYNKEIQGIHFVTNIQRIYDGKPVAPWDQKGSERGMNKEDLELIMMESPSLQKYIGKETNFNNIISKLKENNIGILKLYKNKYVVEAKPIFLDYITGEKLNFKYNNKNYKVEFEEKDGDLFKVKTLEDIEVIDKDQQRAIIKIGTSFRIGGKTLNKE